MSWFWPTSLPNPVQTWLAAHPRLVWLIVWFWHHPAWFLATLGLLAILVISLAGAISRMTSGAWIWLFQRLWQGLRWVVQQPFRWVGWHWQKRTRSTRMAAILSRLDQLQAEQAALLTELKQLSSGGPPPSVIAPTPEAPTAAPTSPDGA